jgi:hypothetical protein
MRFILVNKITGSFMLTGILCMLTFSCYPQGTASPISSPEHQRILQAYKSKAEEFCAKNLNRFGLYQLQNYDKALDSLVAKEKEDTLSAIQKNYVTRNIQRKILTDSLKIQSAQLARDKETYLNKYHSLLRKAGIAFVIWLVIVFLMLKWRNRSVKKSQLLLDSNIIQLRFAEQSFVNGEELLKSSNEWEQKNLALSPHTAEIQKSVSALKDKMPPEITQGDAFKKLLKNIDVIVANSMRLRNFAGIIPDQYREPGQEKVITNINLLCDQYADLAYTQMLQEDGLFTCQFTKDFEKNLPQIKVAPDAVGSLLLFVLSNAFNSVHEKIKKETKGYTAKVSISTRVLPRFVQIRIKDNGDGMTDLVMNQIYEPFYSAKTPGEGSGLGLYFSEQIIKENNGEIKIESEPGNGTDVYLKFFLKS